MSEPELPNMATRALIITFVFFQACACDTPFDKEKCSRCTILNELRLCWPFDYAALVDVLTRRGGTV